MYGVLLTKYFFWQEVLKNMASLVAHCFLGYYIRKIQAKIEREEERVARILRMER